MSIRTRAQAIQAALNQTVNRVGTCQLNVRGWYLAPSVGDVDGDGDADAVDGWESEPKAYRHPGDRNPPHGVPLAFHGGSRGFGHRAMTLGHAGRVRSTDMLNNRYSPGHTSTVTGATTSAAIAQIEASMNVVFTGWSETIDGGLLDGFEKAGRQEPAPQTRGWRVDQSLRRLRKAQALAREAKQWTRVRLLGAAIKSLLAIPTHDKK